MEASILFPAPPCLAALSSTLQNTCLRRSGSPFVSLNAVIKGIEAGLDMFIFRNSDDETLKMIDELAKIVEKDEGLKSKIVASNHRIEFLKKKYGI